jgi:pimeloyl-ACP methyl ester carboxylesterase
MSVCFTKIRAGKLSADNGPYGYCFSPDFMKQESKLPDFDFCESHERMIAVDANVSLKVFEFIPASVHNPPFVIVTGLATMIDSFLVIIRGLAKTYPVYYIETRDKTSSAMNKEKDFSIQAMGRDVSVITRELALIDNRYFFIGYSLGSSVIAEAYRHLHSKPAGMIFMEPTAEFNYPRWSLFLIRYIGVSMYTVLKNLAKWYLVNFVINKEEDRQMIVISFNSLDHADPVKLAGTVLSVAGYTIWNQLPRIKCPSLIVGTTKDGLHQDEHLKKMFGLLVDTRYVDLETNERTHNEDMVYEIIKFVEPNFREE